MNDEGLTVLEAESRLAAVKTERDLAALYAVVDREFWTVADEEYERAQGTKQHAWAVEHTDRRARIRQRLETDIFAQLQREGVVIPATRRIDVLIPFMERNGYVYTSAGWKEKT